MNRFFARARRAALAIAVAACAAPNMQGPPVGVPGYPDPGIERQPLRASTGALAVENATGWAVDVSIHLGGVRGTTHLGRVEPDQRKAFQGLPVDALVDLVAIALPDRRRLTVSGVALRPDRPYQWVLRPDDEWME